MNRFLTVGYGALCYAVFMAAFLYAIGFVGNIAVPRSVDRGVVAPIGQAVAVNVLLLALFAIQHSVMARPAFKRWWTRFVPSPVERSTYVLLASLVLFLLYWQWRTMPAVVWDLTSPLQRLGLWALFWLGWVNVLAATFMINHFELFGLRQVYSVWREKPNTDLGFRKPVLYRFVRHPIMLGFIMAFWATPTMTAGHLLFAVCTTGYILVAVHLEERDLAGALGDPYREYRSEVAMFLPHPMRHKPIRVPGAH
jgi:protein-S-isoprenylcysteine O-methyltransferase Ste14